MLTERMFGMKRAYSTPKARMIDFAYDEQVVATSTGGCDKLYNIGSKEANTDCVQILKEEIQTYGLQEIGCGIYNEFL